MKHGVFGDGENYALYILGQARAPDPKIDKPRGPRVKSKVLEELTPLQKQALTLVAERGSVRAMDLAGELGGSQQSAFNILAKLYSHGLVDKTVKDRAALFVPAGYEVETA